MAAPSVSGLPTIAPTPSSAAPSSTTTAVDCPAAGAVRDVAGYLVTDARCFAGGPVRVAGWLTPVYPDEYAYSTSAWRALRASLPGADVRHTSAGYGDPGNPVVYLAFQSAFMSPVSLPAAVQWIELNLRPEGADVRECGWQVPPESAQPAEQVCLPLALVSSAATPPPPAATLAACPPVDTALPASWFSVLPRACFGVAEVTVSGWLGMTDSMAIQPAVPWSIEPDWLWPRAGPGLGITPDSETIGVWSVLLHFPPGHGPWPSDQDRWATVRGHYAVSESAQCRYVYPAGYDPVASGPRLDDAGARAACANAFVVDDITAGVPGSY